MIMEIAESIFKFILASLNVCALAFTLILVSKWHIRMENKLDDIERYVRRVFVTILFSLTSSRSCKES